MPAVALPKDDWTPAKLKDHRAWRNKMYSPSINKISVRRLEAKISRTIEAPVSYGEIKVSINFGYPILPINEYKVFKFKTIQRAVSAATDVSVNDILSQAKQMHVLRARMTAIMLCKILSGPEVSSTMLGRAFGGRDHTTILHAIRKTQPAAAAVRRRVDPSAPLNQFVSAALDAWDEFLAPMYYENQVKSRHRALSIPREGTRWTNK